MTRQFGKTTIEDLYMYLEKLDQRIENLENRKDHILPVRSSSRFPPGQEGQIVIADSFGGSDTGNITCSRAQYVHSGDCPSDGALYFDFGSLAFGTELFEPGGGSVPVVLRSGLYIYTLIATCNTAVPGKTVQVLLDMDTSGDNAFASSTHPLEFGGFYISASCTLGYYIPAGGGLDGAVRQASGSTINFTMYATITAIFIGLM